MVVKENTINYIPVSSSIYLSPTPLTHTHTHTQTHALKTEAFSVKKYFKFREEKEKNGFSLVVLRKVEGNWS
jgi:hypothetical protein